MCFILFALKDDGYWLTNRLKWITEVKVAENYKRIRNRNGKSGIKIRWA